MDHTVDAVVAKVLDQGPIGIVCLILLGAVWMLWRALREEQAAFRELAAKATEALAHSSRTIAAMETAVENTNRLNETRLEVLRTVSSTVEGQTASNKRIEEEVRRLTDRIPVLGGAR